METIDIREVLKSIPKSDDTGNVEKDYDNVEIQLKKEQLREAKLRNAALEGENIGDSQDRAQRKEFAEKIFSFVCLYMFSVFLILFLCGSPGSFKLSDTVLITLLGTTTANVIGILIIVVKYLFSRNNKK